MKLVVNASPLILLTAAGQLEILHGLADEIVVPSVVLDELKAGSAKDHAAEAVRAAAWIEMVDVATIAPAISAWDLGAGETGVLAWANERRGHTCVLDDRAARNCARILGLPCVGTLGLVLAAKEATLLPKARPVLEAMTEAGFYLAGGLLDRALRRVGE